MNEQGARMTRSSISAAALIGGHSRRMGTPKALLRLVDGGETLLERTVTTLQAIADDVVLVGTPGWSIPAPAAGCRQAADLGTSAADGIVTALDEAAHRWCVVVACDMPFLDPRLLREMADLAQRTRRGVIAADAHGAHPLHAVWDREQLPSIRTARDRGERSLGELARIAGMQPLDLASPGRSDGAQWSVFNINTPHDLDVARRHAAGEP
jgi:molybdopterin-guanine dinucleotide biosynthesis protein A